MKNRLLTLPEVFAESLGYLKKEGANVSDTFTIQGFGWGSRGQIVVNDWNPKTRRRCKCVRLRVYKIDGGLR